MFTVAQREKGNRLTKTLRNFVLTLAALTVFAAPAFAITGIRGGTSFYGDVVNSANHRDGHLTISGLYDEPNLTIHIVDDYFAMDCPITETSQIHVTYDPGTTQSGNMELVPTICHPTRNPTQDVTAGPNAVINLGWSTSSVVTNQMDLVGRGMYLMLPGFCVYDGFSGVGRINP